MTLFEEIMSALELYSKEDKAELAHRLISEGGCDPDLIIEELGLTDKLNIRKEAVEQEVWEENSLDAMICDVPTEKIADYVNEIMEEMR